MIEGSLGAGSEGRPHKVIRGMSILSCDGQVAGRVAALVLDTRRRLVTHVVLCCLPVAADYKLVPAELIVRVTGEAIELAITREEINCLPSRTRQGDRT